jgi:hypothetical protein
MNELFEHGIHTENSDVRAHVSVCNRMIYVFQTVEGRRAIERNHFPLANAWQDGVAGRTAEGWLVRIECIDGIRRLWFNSWTKWDQFTPNLNTSQKGKLAVECVVDLMKGGYFPFWIDEATESDRENVQIKGTDIIVFARKKIQVKCDWRAGETGNLFLQRAERNPLKRF